MHSRTLAGFALGASIVGVILGIVALATHGGSAALPKPATLVLSLRSAPVFGSLSVIVQRPLPPPMEIPRLTPSEGFDVILSHNGEKSILGLALRHANATVTSDMRFTWSSGPATAVVMLTNNLVSAAETQGFFPLCPDYQEFLLAGTDANGSLPTRLGMIRSRSTGRWAFLFVPENRNRLFQNFLAVFPVAFAYPRQPPCNASSPLFSTANDTLSDDRVVAEMIRALQ